ncbi:response regulator [Denitrificimonas caeni]|uniref:Response regulator n=1 Tax=Denitrificimonas caeni TaxID=521720 RepID=A0AAE9VPN4_9GAMM|nr:response regulator [Denitrificimonas caeni]WBE25627.1 response regulator [Denitrificimonas caeni]
MHILLVEDDPLIAQGLLAGLQLQGFTLDHMAHAAAAEQALQLGHFDAVILDLGLPDEDGLELLTRLRNQGKDLPVLILSARDSVVQRVAGLQAGADDYLLKPFDLRELAARLHSLLRRSGGRSTNLIEHHGLSFNPTTREVTLHGQTVALSRREQALLGALLQNPGHILSAEQLQDSLYGLGDGVESNAINVHIYNLRRKLGSEVVKTVRGLGYRMGVPREST